MIIQQLNKSRQEFVKDLVWILFTVSLCPHDSNDVNKKKWHIVMKCYLLLHCLKYTGTDGNVRASLGYGIISSLTCLYQMIHD